MSPKSPKFATESLPLFVLPLSIVYHYSQLKVYHYLYNNIELIQRNRFWYCFCYKTLGYGKNGQKKYSLPCMLEMDKTFETYELEKVKKCSLKHLFFAKCVFDSLKKIADFNKSIVELWSSEVSYRGRDYDEGSEWQVYLTDVI